jgi:hypothetical protein
MSVGEPPELAASGLNQKEEAATVRKFECLSARLCIPNSDVI